MFSLLKPLPGTFFKLNHNTQNLKPKTSQVLHRKFSFSETLFYKEKEEYSNRIQRRFLFSGTYFTRVRKT